MDGGRSHDYDPAQTWEDEMNYQRFFEEAIDQLHAERRYRVFADLERIVGRFPRALWRANGRAQEITIWCSNDYLGMGQNEDVIAAFQTNQIDYSVFSTDMAEQIRAQSGAVAPLIQQFGALKTIEHRGQQSGADMFRVVFEKQATDWVIAFDDQDQIAALLFRPAQD